MPPFTLLFKEINIRQNMANWTQLMRTHDLTQAQDLGSYALIAKYID